MSIFDRLARRLRPTRAAPPTPALPPPATSTAAPATPEEALLARGLAALRGDNARSYARSRALPDAQALLAAGQSGMARTLLAEALAEHASGELRALLVKVLLARGERGPALQLLRALALEPEHAHAAELTMGQLREDDGDLDGARRHYERAMAIQPDAGGARERARRLRARLEGSQGLPPEAWRTMSRLWGETAAGNRYHVVEEVGRGGAATLFRATEAATGRTVALKVFHARGDPAVRAERIAREARVAARFDNPYVVPVLDAIPERDLMVMPFYPGGSLRTRLSQGPLAPRDAVLMCLHLAHALTVVHQAGVAHLDVKPSNVLLMDGRPALADFGAAGAVELGQVAGTPPYMAPEQLEGAAVDARADLYALGVVLLECLVGNATTDASNLLFDATPWRRAAGTLAASLVSHNPTDRPATAAETALALGVVLDLMLGPEAAAG
jgi:tetratricopeptide (TPR) repeat protein